MPQKIVVPERPLVLPPQLAVTIGTNAALVLQQIHYWCRKSKKVIDGAKWFWKTYKDWCKELPLSVGTIRRAIAFLKNEGLIEVDRKSAPTYYQANWYTINYEAIDKLWEKIIAAKADSAKESKSSICSKRSNGSDQKNQIDVPKAITSYTETSPQEKISTDTPPNPPQLCNLKISDSDQEGEKITQGKTPHQGMGNCAEILRKIKEKIEKEVETKETPQANPEEQISPAAPPPENLPSIPLEDELKRLGINTSDRRLLTAISQSSDPYLAIKAWLEWAATHSVRNPQSSLIVAINKNWRSSEPAPRTEDNFSAATCNNSSQKPFLETIPPCPSGLEEWALHHEAVKEVTYSTFYNSWAIVYRNGVLLPWLAAVERGKTIFKAVQKDSNWCVEVEL